MKVFRRFITWGRGETSREEGQSLVLFAAAALVMVGFVALTIDVGRFVWARTQMQAAVDAAALAAAQSMPDKIEAEAQAQHYWNTNAEFINRAGKNVRFYTNFPGDTNKGVHVKGEAEIPTIFAHLFGLSHWDVSAEGVAESQVLDIALVLDTSGSMCFGTYPDVESGTAWMGPGKNPPKLDQNLSSTTGNTNVTVKVTNAKAFESYVNQSYGGRKGTIKIGNELLRVRSVDTKNNTIKVDRAQRNDHTGQNTPKLSHSKGAEIWRNWNSCADAARYNSGPYEPYDTMIDDAEFFVTLFDDRYDKIGVASFSSTAKRAQSLTSNFGAVHSTLNSLAIPEGGTNIAHGLGLGRGIVTSSGTRDNSLRIIVFLTDGVANQYCSGTYSSTLYTSTSCTSRSGEATARDHALREADAAASRGIVIYTIGLGPEVDDALLNEIARRTGGEYHKAPTIAQLDDAFRAIAQSTHVKLSQ